MATKKKTTTPKKTEATQTPLAEIPATVVANRLLALDVAERLLHNRVFDIAQSPYTIPNVESLANLLVNWAATGEGVMNQIERFNAAAQAMEQVGNAEDLTVDQPGLKYA